MIIVLIGPEGAPLFFQTQARLLCPFALEDWEAEKYDAALDLGILWFVITCFASYFKKIREMHLFD